MQCLFFCSQRFVYSDQDSAISQPFIGRVASRAFLLFTGYLGYICETAIESTIRSTPGV